MIMRRLRAALARVRAHFHRDRLDRDLAAELHSHLSMHIDDNRRAGMNADEARRQALLKLGGIAQVEERHRDVRGIPMLEHLIRDVRLGARNLKASPAFTAVTILTLGLGIGANTAIFSIINTALFQPLPVNRPDELVAINRVSAGVPTFSYPDYRDLRDRSTLLAGIAAYRISPMSLEAGGAGGRIWGYLATGNYFDLLGVRAVMGRALARSDDLVPGGHPVLVLSYECWRGRFSADPQIVGRTVKINGAPFTILGVMPAGFRGTERLLVPDLWVPMMMEAHIESGNDWLERRRTENIFLLGRLGPNVSVAQAEASLNAIAAALGREHPDTHEGMRIALSPPGLVGTLLRGPVIGFSGALLAVASLVLLLMCTNLTGLLLARSTDRRRETAIRLALGAGRSDLIRRSLVESGLLSLAGAAVALLLAQWLAAALTGWRLPTDVPLAAHVALDHRVLAYSLALAVLSTILVAFMPALQSTRTDVVPALKEETTRWRGRWHSRDIIVGLQMALSTALLVGALQVVRSLQHATTIDVGFNPRGAVSARVDLGLQGYDQERARDFQRRVRDEISILPGIDSVAVASAVPLGMDVSTHTVYVEGQPEPRGSEVPDAIYYQVSPGFFRTLQTRLVAGRDFASSDTRESTRVAVVNQAFAQLLGSGGPVGQRFRTGRSGEWIEVVGVVQDGKYQTLSEAPKPVAFHSGVQWYNPTTSIVARSSLPESEALDLVRQAVRRLDPSLSLFEDRPVSEILALPLLPARIAAALLGVFGALAIVLVLVGTYGLMSYGIAQRTREICIRLAVGASSLHIVRLVLGRAGVVWSAGVGVGAAVSLVGTPLLSPFLLGVSPRDPVLICLSCGILGLVTAAACWLPTRRALASDPVALFRSG
jgi:predicted permease